MISLALTGLISGGCMRLNELERARRLFANVTTGDSRSMKELIALAQSGDEEASFFAGLAQDPLAQVVTVPTPAIAMAMYRVAGTRYSEAIHNLALLDMAGFSVGPNDRETSLGGSAVPVSLEGLLVLAADRGYKPSTQLLTQCYLSGLAGIPHSDLQAREILERLLARDGDAWAQLQLGTLDCASFPVGSPQYERGLGLLERAAAGGHVSALVVLASRAKEPSERARWAIQAAMKDRTNFSLAQRAVEGLTVQEIQALNATARIWEFAHQVLSMPLDFTKPARDL